MSIPVSPRSIVRRILLVFGIPVVMISALGGYVGFFIAYYDWLIVIGILSLVVGLLMGPRQTATRRASNQELTAYAFAIVVSIWISYTSWYGVYDWINYHSVEHYLSSDVPHDDSYPIAIFILGAVLACIGAYRLQAEIRNHKTLQA